MIITKLRVEEKRPMTGASGSWPLPICDLNLDSSAGENGYILKDTQGLDPPDLISIVEGYDDLGNPVMGSIAEKREIVLQIALNPRLGQTYSSLRDSLYKFINRSVYVNLMHDSLIIAQATGYIPNCEVVHFSKEPDIQMTIKCEEGEFSSPSGIGIPFSDIGTIQPIINYEDGTAPTGLDLQFTVTANKADGFNIFNNEGLWFEVGFAFLIGDVVTISTQQKNKRVSLVRGGLEYDLAGYINGGAVWPKLYPGVNAFEWSFDSSWITWNAASYIPRYWGV